ncbi:MAG: hypothetical protein CTY36_00265 [Methylocystis sp.]|nr:MAG: hypothetical protein CTY36_00265 [Methylocystis sp.]
MSIQTSAQIVAVPLERIMRLSPLNPRQDMESDVSGLAAMIRARGQQYPIKLRVIPAWDGTGADVSSASEGSGSHRDPGGVGDLPFYEVLDGGRRWRALREIADGRDALAVIEEGDEIAAREVALMVSVSPKPLHPVDEFESFARLEESGASVEAIAAHFGESERHVRQRLALGRLSPRVRAKWRAGEIDRDEAVAFTAGPVEAQDALLDALEGRPVYERSAWQIRRRLRGEAMSNSGPEGKYLLSDKARVEAYVAAGGRIEDNLFDDEIIICDPTLAARIVSESLRADAERIKAEEGWGAALIEDEEVYDLEPDAELTIEEQSRYDEIETALTGAEGAEARALEEERDAITRDALLRHMPREEREQYAVVAFLDDNGRVCFKRGLPIPEPEDKAGAGEERADAGFGESLPSDGEGGWRSEPGGVESSDHETIPDPLAEPGKALRGVIDETATQALRDITRRRGDIALMLAVAALGCMYGGAVIKLRSEAVKDDDDNALLAKLADVRFDEALKISAGAPTADLSVALFRLVAASIVTREASFETIGAVCAAVRARGGDLKGAFDAALDRRAFFETAPKAVTLGCVTGLIGEGEAGRVKRMKKGELGEYVARLSKDKGHLPAPLADWAAAPELLDAGVDAIRVDEAPSLAEAMSAAIVADRKDGAELIEADRTEDSGDKRAPAKRQRRRKAKAGE